MPFVRPEKRGEDHFVPGMTLLLFETRASVPPKSGRVVSVKSGMVTLQIEGGETEIPVSDPDIISEEEAFSLSGGRYFSSYRNGKGLDKDDFEEEEET